MVVRILRFQFQRFFQQELRLPASPLRGFDDPEQEDGAIEIRVQSYRVVEKARSLVVLVCDKVADRDAVRDLGEIRVEFGGFFKHGHRLTLFSVFLVKAGQGDVACGILRIQFNRLAQLIKSLFLLTGEQISLGNQTMVFRTGRGAPGDGV